MPHLRPARIALCWPSSVRAGTTTRSQTRFARSFVHSGRTAFPLLNDPKTVLWNLDKVYLRDVASLGARIPETVWIGRGEGASLVEAMDAIGANEVVVKPSVSLSAVDTFRVSRALLHESEEHFRDLSSRKGLLVQMFLPEIAAGEYSLVFFRGVFSHAVRKLPAPGDFRVQVDHGGRREACVVPLAWQAEVQAVLAKLPPMAFARVDVVETSEGLVWMELEAIDPMLFFGIDPAAAERFAEVVSALATRDA